MKGRRRPDRSGMSETVQRALYLNLDELRRWLVMEYPDDVTPRIALDLISRAAHGYPAWLRLMNRRDKDYRLPRPPLKMIRVDKKLDASVLDRLNLIRGIRVVSTCHGHPKGAHIGYRVVGADLDGPKLAQMTGARLWPRGRTWWIEPEQDPPLDGVAGGIRWFDAMVEHMERSAAMALKRAEHE